MSGKPQEKKTNVGVDGPRDTGLILIDVVQDARSDPLTGDLL